MLACISLGLRFCIIPICYITLLCYSLCHPPTEPILVHACYCIAHTDTDTDIDADTDTDTDTDTGTGTGTGSGSGSGIGTGTGTGTRTGTDTDADADADIDTDTDANTNTNIWRVKKVCLCRESWDCHVAKFVVGQNINANTLYWT